MTTIYHNGRCKLHGGKSTGAKTPEGKARVMRKAEASIRSFERASKKATP
ncbi:HGGxSTG domain-containing protein [Klebsiella variicola]